MKKTIAVLPGDGVGKEVTSCAVLVLKKIAQKFNHQFEFIEGLIGHQAILKTGVPLPKETKDLVGKADAILFGAIGDPYYDQNPNLKVRPEQGLLELRKSLGLYANLRPIKVFPSLVDNVSSLFYSSGCYCTAYFSCLLWRGGNECSCFGF